MTLPSELVSSFVKATKDTARSSKESTVYGTIRNDARGKPVYVQIDGSDQLTPIATTSNVAVGDRVVVMIKDHSATIVGNVSNPSATTTEVSDVGTQVDYLEIVVADKIGADILEAELGRIDELYAENVEIRGKLDAQSAEIDELEAEDIKIKNSLSAASARIDKLESSSINTDILDARYAKIGSLEAVEVDVYNLDATFGDFQELTATNLNSIYAEINKLEADKASIAELEAAEARIDTLEANNADITDLQADVAKIDTLIFGSASGTTIQSSFANAVIAQLSAAQIKSAMIDSISASKISSGDILTNNVRVLSEDGKLLISDETIQISDDAHVRVQIGKDAAGDYSINIWDADGNLMFSEGGITDSAIKEAIIRDDMVSDNANISADKLNIESLFEVINNDGSNTLKASKIKMDGEGQTLDVSFTKMTSDMDELSADVSSQGTDISVIQGQIESKVWQQDIDTATDEMSTQYSLLEQDLNGFRATVGETYATKDDISNINIGGRNLFEKSADLIPDYMGFYSCPEREYSYGEDPTVPSGKYMAITFTADQSATYAGGPYLASYKTGYIPKMISGEEYTVSVWTKCSTAKTIGKCSIEFLTDVTYKEVPALSTEWQRYVVTGTYNGNTEASTAITFYYATEWLDGDVFYISSPKVEKGNKATDWTPAPEDLEIRIANNESTIVQLSDRIATNVTAIDELGTHTETLIQQLSHNISMLVTDGNGTSMMTQTDSGWTFSTAEIQANVSDVAEGLDALTNELGDTSSAVDVLKQAVADLGEIAEYVKIGTYEDEPCIELGEGDSEFKMRITNTRILFMEGSNVVAHISNQSLHIKKAVIEEELQQGGFVWKVRSNGNMGLVWKGVSS